LETSEGPGLRLTLAQASAEAKAALSELRDLAQGIHPQILSEAGLETAVESLADRAQVAVTVEIPSSERYVPAVESAAYFVVAEALTNVAKYAAASHVLVRAAWRDGILTLEVSDDGIGGADPSAGSGLRGLVDRLAVIDGTLEVVSPTGGGTRLLAQIPSAAPTMMPG
jgi:signal transduction histidine kinase